MKTYQQIKDEIEKLTRKKAIMDALISCGVPMKKCHTFVIKGISSGYSMGEDIVIRCKGKVLVRYDHTQEYAKSCQWKAKHGHIVIDFTKKDLKEYVDLCAQLHDIGDRINDRTDGSRKIGLIKTEGDIYKKCLQYINARINEKESIIKK